MVRADPVPRWGRAAVLALIVEVALLTGTAWLVTRPTRSPVSREEIQLELTTLPPVEAPKPPDPVPPKVEPAKPEPQKMQVKPVPRKLVPPPPPVPVKTAPPPSGPVGAVASDFAEAPPAPPVEPVPVRSAPKPDVTDLFQAEARAAVQAALRYPNAARIRKLTGQSRVGFDYRDGQVSNARIVTSSGYDILDDAAINALNSASLPAPPQDLAGHLLKLTIAVNFSAQP
jgi:protein TonB